MGEAREIYLKACGEVADALQADGFRWRKSRQDTVRKDGDLTFRVSFQSSFRNTLLGQESDAEKGASALLSTDLFVPLELQLAEIERFGSVAFIVHVSVHAQSIKKWRATLAHPVRTGDGLAGTNLGHLASKPRWLELNLANPETRTTRIHAIIDLIRTSGFHYFDRFKRPDEVVAALLSSRDPGMIDDMELEYAVCYGSMQAGSTVLTLESTRMTWQTGCCWAGSQ
jgi:hypothetical protein